MDILLLYPLQPTMLLTWFLISNQKKGNGEIMHSIRFSSLHLSTDCSWTQICFEGRILLGFEARDKSTLHLKKLTELTPDALAQQIPAPHSKINSSSIKMT